MNKHSDVIEKITPALLGMVVALGISALIDIVVFGLLSKLSTYLYVSMGISLDGFYIYCLILGIICFALYLAVITIIKRKLNIKFLEKQFYITLIFSIFLYAFGSGWYWNSREEFGFISFFVIIFMWIVAGIINVLFLRIKKIRNSKLYKEQKQWHQKDM